MWMISMKAVLDIVSQYCPDDDGSCSKAGVDLREMLDEIEGLDETEVQPVKHGRWIDFPECLEYEGALDEEYFVCSECHHVWNTIDNCAETFRYCPNCGSKNEGGDEK